jgi:ribosomal protein S28E/S33
MCRPGMSGEVYAVKVVLIHPGQNRNQSLVENCYSPEGLA